MPNILWKLLAISLLLGKISAWQNTNMQVTGTDIYDGFETASLSNVWETSRFVAGSVEMQKDVVRAGHRAVRITVHAHDKFQPGINGKSDSERDELLEARNLNSRENDAYEYSFSMFFPTNFPIVPTRLVIAQWKQFCPERGNCSRDNPVLAIRYVSGVLKITQDIGKKQTILFQKKDEFRHRWLDFKFRVRFSTNENGRIEAWLDDKHVVNYKGATANSENTSTGYPTPSRFYFKMGLYRNAMAEPMTIYIDEYRKRQLPDKEL